MPIRVKTDSASLHRIGQPKIKMSKANEIRGDSPEAQGARERIWAAESREHAADIASKQAVKKRARSITIRAVQTAHQTNVRFGKDVKGALASARAKQSASEAVQRGQQQGKRQAVAQEAWQSCLGRCVNEGQTSIIESMGVEAFEQAAEAAEKKEDPEAVLMNAAHSITIEAGQAVGDILAEGAAECRVGNARNKAENIGLQINASMSLGKDLKAAGARYKAGAARVKALGAQSRAVASTKFVQRGGRGTWTSRTDTWSPNRVNLGGDSGPGKKGRTGGGRGSMVGERHTGGGHGRDRSEGRSAEEEA